LLTKPAGNSRTRRPPHRPRTCPHPRLLRRLHLSRPHRTPGRTNSWSHSAPYCEGHRGDHPCDDWRVSDASTTATITSFSTSSFSCYCSCTSCCCYYYYYSQWRSGS